MTTIIQKSDLGSDFVNDNSLESGGVSVSAATGTTVANAIAAASLEALEVAYLAAHASAQAEIDQIAQQLGVA